MEVAHFVVGYHSAFYKCFCDVKAVSSLAVRSCMMRFLSSLHLYCLVSGCGAN